MAEPIPFVTNDGDDITMVREYHPGSKIVHVPLRTAEDIAGSLPKGVQMWVDPEIDRYHRLHETLSGRWGGNWKGNPWEFPPDIPKKSAGQKTKEFQKPWKYWVDNTQYLKQFKEYSQLAGASVFSNLSKPVKQKLTTFVVDVLRKCSALSPKWITIPQMPLTAGKERNAVNKFLCKEACRWRSDARADSRLVLPVVFSERGLYGSKGQRTERIGRIAASYKVGQFDGIWIADATLPDQKASHIYRDRFRALVDFHEELAEKLPAHVFQVAGPYWGMNLVLWARGDVQFPAIGLGRGYQYFIPGGHIPHGNLRLPLPPLKRWAEAAPKPKKHEKAKKTLKDWLASALRKLSSDDPAYKQFRELHGAYNRLANEVAARRELAKFYSQWCAELAVVPPAGRALALWQALSSAYVLGKQFPSLPEGGTSADPAQVAKQFMDCCL